MDEDDFFARGNELARNSELGTDDQRLGLRLNKLRTLSRRVCLREGGLAFRVLLARTIEGGAGPRLGFRLKKSRILLNIF